MKRKPDVWPDDVVAFVKSRVLEDETVNYAGIARAVNVKFPGRHMSKQTARSIGERFIDLRGRPPTEMTCQYKALVGGTLQVCGADGYPYCTNHRKHVATAPSGSRFQPIGEFNGR